MAGGAVKDGPMDVAELLAGLEVLGFTLQLDPEGRPHLRGKEGPERDVVLRILKARRAEVIRALGGNPEKAPPPPAAEPDQGNSLREWLWRWGQQWTETAEDNHPAAWHPAGAWWWRRSGERTWKPVPGRPVEGDPAASERGQPTLSEGFGAEPPPPPRLASQERNQGAANAADGLPLFDRQGNEDQVDQ